MNEDDVFNQTKGAYLCLIHPIRKGDAYKTEIMPVLALAPSVPDELVSAMITGASWRERLLGLCMAMARRDSAKFIEPMLQSLRDPRGIAIVPACATLGVLARGAVYPMTDSFGGMFDRQVFDGEIGWAADKAMHFVGLRSQDVPGRGPNYAQIFEDHVQVYSWVQAS
jgi:hypothetical protein